MVAMMVVAVTETASVTLAVASFPATKGPLGGASVPVGLDFDPVLSVTDVVGSLGPCVVTEVLSSVLGGGEGGVEGGVVVRVLGEGGGEVTGGVEGGVVVRVVREGGGEVTGGVASVEGLSSVVEGWVNGSEYTKHTQKVT